MEVKIGLQVMFYYQVVFRQKILLKETVKLILKLVFS